MENVRDAINARGFIVRDLRVACDIRGVASDMALFCYRLDDTGRAFSPCFHVFLSDTGDWVIQTYRDESFIVPMGADLPCVVARIVESMNYCMVIEPRVILELGLTSVPSAD